MDHETLSHHSKRTTVSRRSFKKNEPNSQRNLFSEQVLSDPCEDNITDFMSIKNPGVFINNETMPEISMWISKLDAILNSVEENIDMLSANTCGTLMTITSSTTLTKERYEMIKQSANEFDIKLEKMFQCLLHSSSMTIMQMKYKVLFSSC